MCMCVCVCVCVCVCSVCVCLYVCVFERMCSVVCVCVCVCGFSNMFTLVCILIVSWIWLYAKAIRCYYDHYHTTLQKESIVIIGITLIIHLLPSV